MSTMEGFDACRQALAPLLARAQEIKTTRNSDAADALTDELVDFINASQAVDPAEAPAIGRLDALAHTAMGQMHAVAIGGAVDHVVDLSAELQAIGRTLDAQTTTNLDAAERLRLTPLRDLIDRLTGTVAAAKDVARALDATKPDEAQLVRDIGTAAARLQALVVSARTLAGG